MDKSKRPFRKSKHRPFHKKKRSFRKRLPPIKPGDRIDYRNLTLITRFISDHGKILARGRNKVTLKQQRLITIAIKQARILSLLPFMNNRRINKAKALEKKKGKSARPKDKSERKKGRASETTLNQRQV